jgi:DNA-binding ferritin-like protein
MIHRSNFEILHWKAIGSHFDTMHVKVTSEYYEMVAKSIDKIAEMGLRLNENPVNYLDAYRVAVKTYPDILVVSGNKDYDQDAIITYTDAILKNILDAIESVLYSDEMQNTHSNVGIKSSLEAMYDMYDHEYRFLNERRKGE